MGYISISAPNECILAHLKKSHFKLIYKDLALTLQRQVGAQIYSNQTLVLKGIYHWLSPSFYSIFFIA